MQTNQFIDACKSGDEAAVRSMLQADGTLAALRASSGETPVLAALYGNHLSVVEMLIEAGAPLDLFAAAALGKSDIVQARLDGNEAVIDAHSYDGWTALHLASFFGHPMVAELLLARGADVNARSTNSLQNTPLHAAVAGGRVASALALIEAGADVTATDSGRHTPFHIAAEGGYLPVVEALLQRGADPHAVDADDRTPLARAAAKNHAAVVDMINLTPVRPAVGPAT